MSRGLVALLCLLVSACALFADRDDYLAYRRVQRTRTQRERLLSMRDYVDAFPEGQWVTELKRELSTVEAKIFRTGASDPTALELYLELYPEGRYAVDARARLSAVARTGELAALDVPASSRPHQDVPDDPLGDAMAQWVPILARLDASEDPLVLLVQREAELRREMAREPRARCTRSLCAKRIELSFSLPVVASTRIDRAVDLWVRLVLEQGRVRRAELLLTGRGFSRWFESASRTPVDDRDPEARREALRWALTQLEASLARALPYAESAPAGHAVALDPVPEALHPEQVSLLLEPAAIVGVWTTERARVSVFVAPDTVTKTPSDGLLFEYPMGAD